MLNSLFTTNQGHTTATANSRSLPGTVELTNLASDCANTIIKAMDANAEEYAERIKASTIDSTALDNIIDELMPNVEDKADFLKELDNYTIDNMLKSQQSKRSRAKSKVMTLDNYKTLMTAAIAEKFIRDVTGRSKVAGHRGSKAGIVDYTGPQLEELAEDQEKLRREIRNIQSKKSIMKSKADFSETDERWIALLKAESMLKDLRVGGSSERIIEVDTTKNELANMLAGIDIKHLGSKDAHALLEQIQQTVTEQ